MRNQKLILIGLIVLSLIITSGIRAYNAEEFIHQQSAFLPDGWGEQLVLFVLDGLLCLSILLWAYRKSQRNPLIWEVILMGVGVVNLAVLACFFALDFLCLRFQLSLLPLYFRKYGSLYLIPGSLALFTFALKALNQQKRDKTSGEHGTAAYANRQDLQKMGAYLDEGSLFGKDGKGQFLRYPLCNRTIISQTGGGKTSGVVIPALLSENRPMFIHDLKGELWAVTAQHRREAFGHQVVAIDPYRITQSDTVFRYNPMDAIPREHAHRDEAISALVRSLSARSTRLYGKDNHFEDMAETLLLGLIEWVIVNEPTPTLILVHDLLCQPNEVFNQVLIAMRDSNLLRAKAAGAQVLAAAREERGSIMTTTYRQLSWLADPNLRDLVSETNFELQNLIRGSMDVYIAMPSAQAREQSRVFRMLLTSVRNLLVQTPRAEVSPEKILFLFDELGQLGHCQDIEDMLPLMRAYHAVFWSVFQDIGQIKKYGEMKGLFTGAKLMQFFGITDSDTIRWICELGGRKTYISTSQSKSKGQNGFKNGSTSHNESKSQQESGTELIKFNEVREMPFEKQLVFIQGKRPIQCNKLCYFKDPFFKGKFDLNPFEGGLHA